jgi:hypothetical protein
MEAAMNTRRAIIAGALAVLSGSLLVSGRAEAGASASAPSKYSNQAASVHQARIARSSHVAITEYSSSSAKNPSQKQH